KHNIRRVIANIEYNYNRDIFTDRYINSWLSFYPDFVPDEMFGFVLNVDEKRIIGDGIRNAQNFQTGGDVTVNLMNEMSFFGEYKYFSATELTGEYSGDAFNINYSTRPVNKGAELAGIFSVGKGTLYNFDQKYVGKQKSLSIDGMGRLGRNFLSNLQGAFTQTYNPSGENDGQYFKVSSNSTLMFTKDFYFRFHAQGIFGTTWYSNKQIYNEYLLSGLLSWEYRPGSFMYLAYNEGRFDTGGAGSKKYMQLNNRTLILKISYFFSV
ncbi:MAG: hypothetical protein R3182_13335, partial [Draconibacterium sp.]|nr:hypothetical protein [Draconibacterium sp.]